MSATRQSTRTFALLSGIALIGAGAILTGCAEPSDPSPAVTQAPSTPETVAPSPEPTPVKPSFDREAHSIDDPTSIWVVSNKLRPLNPVDFAPTDLVMPQGVENEFDQPLREPAAKAAEELVQAAAEAGNPVRIISAYRDYATQVNLYSGYVTGDGEAAADTYSARPGHSEHQTGLVVDLDDHGDCYLAECFGDTAAGTWLAAHAAEYGFINRYPAGKEGITGFIFEPWHYRYVGPELAQEMAETGTSTLEEFFDLPAAPDYSE